MKTIKMIGTKDFVITVSQLSNGKYVVGTETAFDVNVSSQMADWNTAAKVFDVKYTALEARNATLN